MQNVDDRSLVPTLMWLSVISIALSSFALGGLVILYTNLPSRTLADHDRALLTDVDKRLTQLDMDVEYSMKSFARDIDRIDRLETLVGVERDEVSSTQPPTPSSTTQHVIQAKEAKQFIGQRDAIVEGKILAVKKTSNAWFLDFGLDYRHDFTAVILPAYYQNFPDIGKLTGKTVRIRGEIEHYKSTKGNDQPQIRLKEANQIEDRDMPTRE
jgi:hypothetical protein